MAPSVLRKAPVVPQRMVVPALLALVAVMICARMPNILLEGRFWAEEGNIFYHNAWVMPPLRALFNSFGGYLNLAANGATLAARWLLPVRLAPYLTITIALLVQLCPAALLLTARDAWLRPVPMRWAACLLVLFVPAVEEVWLQTLHCQFHLALCAGILLALEPRAGRAAWFGLALLLLAPLCGPGAIALLPLFALRTMLERTRPRLLQTLALGFGSTLQLALFFHSEHARGYSLQPVMLLNIITVRHIWLPILGVARADAMAPRLRAEVARGLVPHISTVLPFVVFLPWLAATLWRRRRHAAFWFLAAGGLLACASYFGALGGALPLIDARAGGRYIFVPQAMFSLSLLCLAATAERWTRRIAWLLVAWVLVLGGIEYVQPWPFIANGPPWRHEVAMWQADPSYRPHVWPEYWHGVVIPAPSQGR
jgi:hypothetical protein